ncbi:deoxyribodipyrimidine photo-lyase/cryptochrome family protein [Hwanghaeella sp.]|uniref:cryptochrome/deoxyribodipyrimidine photo-lyase family protein n=1 Tax=Hwanghaeella sp. TaxID=2605943 RepID=UPI003CCB7D09
MSKPALQIVWYKRDLRIADHAPLAAAAVHGPVLPLYCAEPGYWASPDASARQWGFVADSLSELRQDLSALGQPLVVRRGDVLDVLEQLHRSHDIGGLWSHEETGNDWTFQRDRRVAAWCRLHGVPWTEFSQNGVVRRLGERNGWSRRWDQMMAEPLTPPPGRLPSIPDIDPGPVPVSRDLDIPDDPCPGRQRGGRSRGLERLESFLAERGRSYRFSMSSPRSAETACSRLSPHLAHGTLSMREISQATASARAGHADAGAETSKNWRQSLSSFQARLHWHCHFMQKLEDQPDMEWKNLHNAYDDLRGDDGERLRRWANGETGWPFVDACMRMLIATGWINFRMRAMLMAVASYHLWMDWRKPGEHLARLFTDYEPGIHWPQVQMQSGTTGINLPRIYNPIKQGLDQDPDGVFIRRWVPELADIPDRFIHEPWNWTDAPERLWEIYPQPIVMHLDAAKQARQAIWALRKGDAYRATANEIQRRHGSRKGRRKRRTSSDQMALFGEAPQ